MLVTIGTVVQVRGKSWLGKSVIAKTGELWIVIDVNYPFMTLHTNTNKYQDITVHMTDDDPHFEIRY